MMIPFPFLIKAKYFVLDPDCSDGGFCHQRRRKHGVPGAPGWFALLDICNVKFAPARGVSGIFNLGWYYGLNIPITLEAARAAKKFEVYMQKHDRKVEFDEHGNYIPPEDGPRKGNGGGKSGWVN